MDKLASRHFSALIIDDELQATSELCELLKDSSCRCVASTHRKSTIANFQADPNIGLVICDLYLGQGNGIRLAESLKEAVDGGRFFESIILTDHDDRQEVVGAMRVNAADRYQKPVTLQELLHGPEYLESCLHEHIHSQLSLSYVNQHLEYLAELLNLIYRDVHKIKYEIHGNNQPNILKSKGNQPSASPVSVVESQVSPSSPLFGELSPCQQAVARLVNKSLIGYQIIYELGITEDMVKLHVSQVLRLVHMCNRTQLALALSSVVM